MIGTCTWYWLDWGGKHWRLMEKNASFVFPSCHTHGGKSGRQPSTRCSAGQVFCSTSAVFNTVSSRLLRKEQNLWGDFGGIMTLFLGQGTRRATSEVEGVSGYDWYTCELQRGRLQTHFCWWSHSLGAVLIQLQYGKWKSPTRLGMSLMCGEDICKQKRRS